MNFRPSPHRNPARRWGLAPSRRAARPLIEALEGRQLLANSVAQFAITPVSAAATLAAGAPAQYEVSAEDADGNLVGDFSGQVHFISSDPDAILPLDMALSSGTATVSVTFTKAGQRTVSVEKVKDDGTIDVNTNGTSPGVVVTPGSAVALAVVVPDGTNVGAPLTITVQALDMYGNVATTNDDAINLTSTDPAATLPSSITLSAGAWTATATFATPGPQSISAVDATNALVSGPAAGIVVGQIIQGFVYLDSAANGSFAAGDPLLPGRVVYLDLNNDGQLSPGDPTATTDAQGHFAFNHPAGTAVVRQDTAQDSAFQNSIAITSFAADGSLALGVVPASSVIPLPINPNPFGPTTVTGTGANYVQSLYRSILGRDGSAAEVAGWVAALQAGTTQAEVAAGFVGSTEHHTAEVTSFYATFLDRTPDSFGLGAWVGLLDSGTTDEREVVEGFLNSSEFAADNPANLAGRSAGASNQFVGALYRDVLGRQPDVLGSAAWDAAMLAGTPAARVVAAFVRSAEATDDAIDGMYSALLRAVPTAAEARPWSVLLNSASGTPSMVQEALLGTAAYADLVAAMTTASANSATPSASATGGTIPGPTWYSANLVTPQIAGMARSAMFAHGEITRGDMIALLQAVEANGPVTPGELADLQAIVADSTVIVMAPAVRSLAQKLVDGSLANATYQGQPLGNLAVGSPASQLGTLINKWFLGLDHPTTDGNPATNGSYAYVTPAASLFGPSGTPGYSQVIQGLAGDCYFMSSLASMALHSPAQAIQDLIAPNGDGTYTVRFFNIVDGVATPDYVTVDGMVPEYANGGYVYANENNAISDPTLATWVALVEKAYAQWNAEGFNSQLTESEWNNSYTDTGIGAGSWYANDMIEVLTGDLHYKRIQSQSSGNDAPSFTDDQFREVAAAFAAGSNVVCSTINSPDDPQVVSDHDYAVVAIDTSTKVVTLFNPWGLAGNSEGGNFKPGLVTFTWGDMGYDFYEVAYHPAPKA